MRETASKTVANRWQSSHVGQENVGSPKDLRATPAGFEIESSYCSKTKRDATLAGKSLNIPTNVVLSSGRCRLESSRAAESRHSDGTLNRHLPGLAIVVAGDAETRRPAPEIVHLVVVCIGRLRSAQLRGPPE